MAAVTDTGRTVRQLRDGLWVDVPVVIRNGRYCLCGDMHGTFSVCVGSGHVAGKPAPPRSGRRPTTPQGADAQRYFPLQKRRLPRAIDQAVIDACDGCGPFEQAFYYCEQHRSQAVRNVILASRRSHGVISLHMMLADKGFDIVS